MDVNLVIKWFHDISLWLTVHVLRDVTYTVSLLWGTENLPHLRSVIYFFSHGYIVRINITYLYLSNKFPRWKLSEGFLREITTKKNGNTELIKERRIWRMHANGSEAFSCQRPRPICIARCLLSYGTNLSEDLGKTTALPKNTKKSTSGWRASLRNTFAY